MKALQLSDDFLVEIKFMICQISRYCSYNLLTRAPLAIRSYVHSFRVGVTADRDLLTYGG